MLLALDFKNENEHHTPRLASCDEALLTIDIYLFYKSYIKSKLQQTLKQFIA